MFIATRNRLISNLIRANIVSVTRMTKLVMPAMVKRGRGCLINIGSASSMIPSPLLTVYAATKVTISSKYLCISLAVASYPLGHS